jgi:hypothetical protein
MSPFILGYKTYGLNYIKVYKKGNNFIYPREIPFFGINMDPDMRIYDKKIRCVDKLEFYRFKILIPSDDNYVKDTIKLNDNNGKIIKFITKDDLFCNYNYNLQTYLCSKKSIYYDAVKMEGVFLCLDDNPKGYKKGYNGDYIIKKINKYYIETEVEFKKKYDIYPIINQEPKRVNKRPRESCEVFLSNKKQNLEKDRNYYKFIDRIQNSGISNLHTMLKTIQIYYPNLKYKNEKVYIEDYNYIIKVDKDIFPKLEIYDKEKEEKRTIIVTDYYLNIGGVYNYSVSWYYYLISISKFVFKSII